MAKLLDIGRTLFNLGKGIGLEKPRTGAQQPYSLDKFIGKLQERNSLCICTMRKKHLHRLGGQYY